MHVAQILDRKGREVATIAPDARVTDALAGLKERNCGALVVSADGTTMVGIISERDIVRRLASDPHGTLDAAVSDLMVTDVATCETSWDIERLAGLMTTRRIRHLPVVDDGALAGIVSIGDVVKFRLDALETEREQLVGYIRDGR
jgi:CBS domain-containing protein